MIQYEVIRLLLETQSRTSTSRPSTFSVTNRSFLTINSHTTYPYVELVKRFGTTSCFGTLAFESKIGELRKLCDAHRSRHSAQVTLPKLYWEATLIDIYFEDNPYKFVRINAEMRKVSKTGELMELISESGLIIRPQGYYLLTDGNFVQVKNLEIETNVCMIRCSIKYSGEVDILPGPTYHVIENLEQTEGPIYTYNSTEFLRKVNYLIRPDGRKIFYY